MSVTFWCPDAPTKSVPCRFCNEEWAMFPEGNGRGGKCDQFCTGSTEESVAPEVNLANASARGILGLLGFSNGAGELCGGCDGGTLKQRLLSAFNRDRGHLVREASDTPGGHAGVLRVQRDNVVHLQRMGARVIDGGNTDEQTQRRLKALWELAEFAQANNFDISWG